MKLTDWELPALFRSRASQERDEFLQDSLASSFVLSETLKNWSSSYDPRSRLCVMKFNKKWRHPDCTVMKWYELQTCTKFKSIQHWRNLDTRFYHEFLIIILTDGSACRVERMGEGSRADAIRWVGCTAFDLIKWFSPKDHASNGWSRGSDELIIEVEFPTPFDLLDVLAVCYTIQHKSPRASVYTLQRFNCYFLCNTILAVLTRRVAAWETLIADEDWPALVDDMIDDLNRRLLPPVERQHPVDFFALGLCSLLDPDSSNPAGFLLEPFRSDLANRGRGSVNEELAKMLWCKDIDTAIDQGLALCYSNACGIVGDDSSADPATSRLQSLLEDANPECFPPNGLDLSSIQSTISEQILALVFTWVKCIVTYQKQQYETLMFENRPSLSDRLVGSFAGVFCTLPAPLLAVVIRKLSQDDSHFDTFTHMSKTYGVTVGDMIAAVSPVTRLAAIKFSLLSESVSGDDFASHRLADELLDYIVDNGAECLFRLMLPIFQPDSGPPHASAALAFLNRYFPKYIWEACFLACMTRLRKNNYHSLFAHKATALLTHSLQKGSTSMQTSVSTVAEFQKHIEERIQHHAERVQSFQLASARLVQQDLEWSMIQIWKSLPSGFGARET